MKKTSSINFYSTFIIFLVSSFLGVGIFTLLQISSTDAIISLLIVIFFGGLILFLFIKVFNYMPDLSIEEKTIYIFGKKIGKLFNIIYTFIIYTICLSFCYSLSHFISSQFLSDTPPIFIMILFAVLIVYINIKGINTILNSSLLFILMNIFLFSIAIIWLSPSMEIENLKPLFVTKSSKIFESAIKVILLNTTPIFSILVIPKNKVSNYKAKNLIKSYCFASIITLLVLIITLGNLGIYLSDIYQYPEYAVLRRINVFNIIDKIENIIALQWIFGLFYVASFSVYSITKTIKIKINVINMLLLVTSIVFFSFKIYKDSTTFNTITTNYIPYIRAILVLLIIIISIGAIFKKNK